MQVKIEPAKYKQKCNCGYENVEYVVRGKRNKVLYVICGTCLEKLKKFKLIQVKDENSVDNSNTVDKYS